MHFEVKKGVNASDTEAVSGFETTGSETSCPFCWATQDGDYIRNYGAEKGYGQKLMAVVCDSGKRTGKTYLSGADFDEVLAATEQEASKRLDAVLKKVKLESAGCDSLTFWKRGLRDWQELPSRHQNLPPMLLSSPRSDASNIRTCGRCGGR